MYTEVVLGGAIIGAIITCARSVYTAEWIFFVLGICGIIILGYFFYLIARAMGEKEVFASALEILLVGIINEGLTEPKEISKEFRRLMEKVSKECKYLDRMGESIAKKLGMERQSTS